MLIETILVLAVVGFLVYLLTTYIPMPAPFKQVIIVLVVIVLIIWVLRQLGFADVPLFRR